VVAAFFCTKRVKEVMTATTVSEITAVTTAGFVPAIAQLAAGTKFTRSEKTHCRLSVLTGAVSPLKVIAMESPAT
jgi:hypothetical protein